MLYETLRHVTLWDSKSVWSLMTRGILGEGTLVMCFERSGQYVDCLVLDGGFSGYRGYVERASISEFA